MITEQAFPLPLFYQGWENYQQSLVETITPLSSEYLALPVAPHHWSIGMELNHMIGSRVFWFQRWPSEGDPSLVHWNENQQSVRTTTELVAGLEETWPLVLIDRLSVTNVLR